MALRLLSIIVITLMVAACASTPAPPANNSNDKEPSQPTAANSSASDNDGKPLFSDIAGRDYRKTDMNGKLVVLVYWATWCPPCRKEIPILNEIHDRYTKRGAMVLAVSQDQTYSALKNFLDNNELGRSIKYPIVYGPKYQQVFGSVPTLPTMFFIDKNGKVIGKHEGTAPMEAIAEAIEKNL